MDCSGGKHHNATTPKPEATAAKKLADKFAKAASGDEDADSAAEEYLPGNAYGEPASSPSASTSAAGGNDDNSSPSE